MNIKKASLFLVAAVVIAVVFYAVANIRTNFSTSFVGLPGYDDSVSGVPPMEPKSPSQGGFLGRGDFLDFDARKAGEQSAQEAGTSRRVARTGQLSLLVANADTAASDIAGVASRLGGFVGSSQVYEVSEGVKAGVVTIRVPSEKFDEAMSELKKLAVEVERESANSDDVTDQYVDLEARLRNYRKTEEQYLKIMEQAENVSETLQVSQQLSNIRGQIEQAEAQLQYLSRQVDLSTITATLTAEADVEVFGVRWRPLVVAKQSLRNMMEGLRSYADAMIWFVFSLPVILLWIFTVLLVAMIAWRILRWIYHTFEKPSRSVPSFPPVPDRSSVPPKRG